MGERLQKLSRHWAMPALIILEIGALFIYTKNFGVMVASGFIAITASAYFYGRQEAKLARKPRTRPVRAGRVETPRYMVGWGRVAKSYDDLMWALERQELGRRQRFTRIEEGTLEKFLLYIRINLEKRPALLKGLSLESLLLRIFELDLADEQLILEALTSPYVKIEANAELEQIAKKTLATHLFSRTDVEKVIDNSWLYRNEWLIGAFGRARTPGLRVLSAFLQLDPNGLRRNTDEVKAVLGQTDEVQETFVALFKDAIRSGAKDEELDAFFGFDDPELSGEQLHDLLESARALES